jgi:hypothetical protein
MDMIALQCPTCGHDLQGENNSRVFFCRECALGLDLDEGRLVPYRLRVIQPLKKPAGRPVYFPMWAIESQVSVSDSGQHESGAQRRLSLVPALFIKNINYFGDIGFYLTMRRVPLQETRLEPNPILPADRSLRDALVYPAIYFYREQAMNRDIGPLTARFLHQRFAILLVPFVERDGEFVDALIEWKYPTGALV